MFRMYAGENNSDGIFDWIDTMNVIALKEEAQRLQRAGNFEAALPLMLESVEMRRESHTICLSLSELGELYLDMLKLDEAEAAARRMLHEAFRYDTEQQTRIAGEIIRDIAAEREKGLVYGSAVRLCGLTRRSELNGKHGFVRGIGRSNSRYCVDVGTSRVVVSRANFEMVRTVSMQSTADQSYLIGL